MFDIGLQEMVVIGVLALLVFGPSKLPELGRRVGRLVREFRRASDEFRTTVETNLKLNDLDAPSSLDPAAPLESAGPVAPEPAPASALAEEPAPVAPEPDAALALAEEHGEPFCAQRGSRIVHRRDCAWVRRVPEADRLYFKRLSEAREQALVNCPVCEPWEPAG